MSDANQAILEEVSVEAWATGTEPPPLTVCRRGLTRTLSWEPATELPEPTFGVYLGNKRMLVVSRK